MDKEQRRKAYIKEYASKHNIMIRLEPHIKHKFILLARKNRKTISNYGAEIITKHCINQGKV